jgi:hypothetical protein
LSENKIHISTSIQNGIINVEVFNLSNDSLQIQVLVLLGDNAPAEIITRPYNVSLEIAQRITIPFAFTSSKRCTGIIAVCWIDTKSHAQLQQEPIAIPASSLAILTQGDGIRTLQLELPRISIPINNYPQISPNQLISLMGLHILAQFWPIMETEKMIWWSPQLCLIVEYRAPFLILWSSVQRAWENDLRLWIQAQNPDFTHATAYQLGAALTKLRDYVDIGAEGRFARETWTTIHPILMQYHIPIPPLDKIFAVDSLESLSSKDQQLIDQALCQIERNFTQSISLF